jgi:hypothetical protein
VASSKHSAEVVALPTNLGDDPLYQFSSSEQHEKTLKSLDEVNIPFSIPIDHQETGDSLIRDWEEVKSQFGGVAEVPYPELARFLDGWSALASSARTVEAIAQADLETATFNEKFVRKQVYLQTSGTREIREAAVYAHEEYRKVTEKYLQANRNHAYIRALRENYERYAFVVSREISRRTNNLPRELRGQV